MSIGLSGIFVYPVKALRGVAQTEAVVCPEGLADDRRWVIVGPGGRFLSQRSHPALARITARTGADGLVLSADGRPTLAVDPPDGQRRLGVEIWRDQVSAAAADPLADRWLSEYLGEPCRLGWMDAACRRPLKAAAGLPPQQVSFADGYPCLVIGTESLADLNRRLTAPVPMNRFRPNLVVSGGAAFVEDTWTQLTIGEVRFRAAGPCARCPVTTVDQTTGLSEAPEPLRTLKTFRQAAKGIIFGVNLVVERPGRLRIGDQVRAET